MKRHVSIAITCVLMGTLMLSARPAQATGCGSAAKVTTDIWGNWGKVIKIAGCAGLALASGGVTYEPCYASANKMDKIVQESIKFWNKMAKNSWATIGPRDLTFDKWQEGNIIGTTGRMFISPHPAPNKQVKVKVEKRDGKGKADVVVCKTGQDGKNIKVANHVFAKGKDNIGKVWEYTIKGAKDDIITIHIDGKSAVKSFKYKLRAKILAEDRSASTGKPQVTGKTKSAAPKTTPKATSKTKSAAPVASPKVK